MTAEEKLDKTTVAEAQKSGGPWFITTKGEPGTLPGHGSHADIMLSLTEDSEFENQSGISVTPSLDDFLVKTGMIRVRFDGNTANMTIRTIPNQSQIKSLEEIRSITSSIAFDFKFKKTIFENKDGSFENLLAVIKQIEKADEDEIR